MANWYDEPPVEFELQHHYQGPSWVKDYIYHAHSFYTENKETIPLNLTPEACAAHLQLAPYTKVEVDILPLIAELNETSRNFYATSKDKKKVLESYHDWVKTEGSHAVKYQSFYNDTDLPPASRLSSTFEVDPSEDDTFTRIFWLSKDGWKMEVKEDFKVKSQLKEERRAKLDAREDVDSKGNYVDYPLEEKEESGQKFREERTGLRVFDWIVAPSKLEHFNELDPKTFDHPPEHEVITTATVSSSIAHSPSNESLPEQPTSPWNSSLDPKDSCSNTDRHNYQNDRAAQGWDDDTSIGALGWDAPGNKEDINNSGNAEVGQKSPLVTVSGSWKAVQPKKKKGKGKMKVVVNCWKN